MVEFQTGLELVKIIGFPALLFIVWYLYHRSESRKWQTYLEQQKEASDRQFEQQKQDVERQKQDGERQYRLFENIISQQEKARDQQFELLRETIETVNFHTSQLSRVEQMVMTNQFCPIVRKENQS